MTHALCLRLRRRAALLVAAGLCASGPALAQLTDLTQTPNSAGAGIHKSLQQEIGAGRGDPFTPDSSVYLIQRDPFRAIQRGRQVFQRKFTTAQGAGPRVGDGVGNIELEAALGAGLADSCAACHGRPQGSAGFGGNVFTRPESRDAPHLFGLGLKEMLADEITQDLREIRTRAIARAVQQGHDVTRPLVAKGVSYGSITAHADGSLDTSQVEGVNADLRVRPFFAQGKAISMREFLVGAFRAEMGMPAYDPDLLAASQGQDVVTPSGMLLSGSQDAFDPPPASSVTDDPDHDGAVDEVPVSLIDEMEFYLLNYFKPGLGRQTADTAAGRATFQAIGCATCHVPSFLLQHDRRVADVRTGFDATRSNGVFNRFYAEASPRFTSQDDGSGLPLLKRPNLATFHVENVFTDFKRHDLGPGFHELNFDGTTTTMFLTTPLWGVGSTAPYGHDGRSPTLEDVILRHAGEAQAARDAFAGLADADRARVVAFLSSLVLFSPPDTASNLNPADPSNPGFPNQGHGSIDLSVLFNVPADKE
jgi:cytochrome c553